MTELDWFFAIGLGVVIYQLSAINSLLRDIIDFLDVTVEPKQDEPTKGG